MNEKEHVLQKAQMNLSNSNEGQKLDTKEYKLNKSTYLSSKHSKTKPNSGSPEGRKESYKEAGNILCVN